MPAPTTDEELLDLVRKSALVSPERLEAFLHDHGPLPGRPRKLARRMIRQGLLTVFQASQILQGRYRGFYLSKYLVLERLGQGGAGAVYLCEHAAMGRRVAIKVLSEVQADESDLARFYREARAIAALDHPNLVRAHDIDQEGGLHFLVLEYVYGPNLQTLVEQKGPLGVARAAEYVGQAARGLQHLHEAGLVHRDIKPSNLLIDHYGTVKILDLGLARFFDGRHDKITERLDNGKILGTADYLAPEQAINTHHVDIRADIYSLGATFYFLLAGRPPFAGGSLHQKLLSHHLEEPTPLRELRPDVPEGLAAILERMMGKDRALRYPTPAAVVVALAPWVRERVPPPAEDELPALCPAAGGPPTIRTALGCTPTAPDLAPPDPNEHEPGPQPARALPRTAPLLPTIAPGAVGVATAPRQAATAVLQERAARDTDPALEPGNTVASLSLDPCPFLTDEPPLWRRGWFQAVLALILVLAAAGTGLGIRLAVSGSTPPPDRKQSSEPQPPARTVP
jgi:serine/threonine protein kinase